MKTLLLSAAFGAAFLMPSVASAQAIPQAVVAVVDLSKVTDECNACKTAAATLRGQVSSLQTREKTLAAPLEAEQKAIQAQIDALNGKGTVVDALGGRAYYMGRLELEFPTSSGLKSLGLRPSAFVDVGSVWDITEPTLTDVPGVCTSNDNKTSVNLQPGQSKADCDALVGTGSSFAPGFKEFFLGNSPKPRLSIGVGVNWTSPFGPLRIDLAKALLKQKGDDTKLFSFNVGTQF